MNWAPDNRLVWCCSNIAWAISSTKALANAPCFFINKTPRASCSPLHSIRIQLFIDISGTTCMTPCRQRGKWAGPGAQDEGGLGGQHGEQLTVGRFRPKSGVGPHDRSLMRAGSIPESAAGWVSGQRSWRWGVSFRPGRGKWLERGWAGVNEVAEGGFTVSMGVVSRPQAKNSRKMTTTAWYTLGSPIPCG